MRPEGLTAAARGAATRERILRDAFTLIGEVGWANVSTRLLAGRAGVNAALINYHFRSKESLLREAAAAGIREVLGPALEHMAGAADTGRAVAELLRFLAKELTRAQSRSLLELSMRALDDDEMRCMMTAELEALRSLVARGISRPGLDGAGVAILLVGALDGVLLQRMIDPETDVDAAARAIEQLLALPGGPTDETEETR